MFAVALFAVPGPYINRTIVQTLRHHFNDAVRPYMLITSQWQSWPLFAPDPTRRVSRMHVEGFSIGEEWHTIEEMSESAIPWWRYAKEIKIIERLFEPGREDMRKHYLELRCRRAGITKRTAVRSHYRYYVIPKNDIQQPVDWWKDWQPEWNESIDVQTVCVPETA